MGTKIPALQIAPNRFVGVASITTLGITILDPKMVDLSTEAECNKNPRLKAAKEQRGANQRRFDAKRQRRMMEYARYIEDVTENNRMGGFPPITFWCKDELPYIDGHLDIPGATLLTANDGETQLAAWHVLAEQNPEWLDKNFAFTLSAGSTREEAMQVLHDMNHYANPVSEKETAALNVEGALTKAINAGIKESGRPLGIIKARGDKPTGEFYTTVPLLLHGAIGALNGEQTFDKTPPRQIQDANGQFVQLNGGADRVRDFVAEVMRLDGIVLKEIGIAQMMALGAKFAINKRLSPPLAKSVVAMIEQKAKGDRARVTVQTVAREIFAALS